MKELWISELGMSLEAAISALKGEWAGFKLNRERGEPGRVWYHAYPGSSGNTKDLI